MRSISDQFLLVLPGVLALVLIALFSAPGATAISLVPNIAWVMTLVIATIYPPAWSRSFAFILGLLQDVVFGTPLGSQALLTLFLVQLVSAQAGRQANLPFHIRWLEASGILLIWHVLLWALCHFVSAHSPSLVVMLRMGIVSALWYPLFYFLFARLLLLLPPLK